MKLRTSIGEVHLWCRGAALFPGGKPSRYAVFELKVAGSFVLARRRDLKDA